MISDNLKNTIVSQISAAVKPFEIFLFGSHAYGIPHKDSDIDLLVVVDSDVIPQSYDEKSKIYLSVSRSIRDVERKIPIDLIVYTKPEFERFKEVGSIFSRRILKDGVRLL
ncbi:MAG: nucleotidyltransferase domain-containing protein [Campylobacterales bacterium]|nr:nucleotidyltransferase domain-containing protein [Campylobacterales bacterium]